MHGGAAHSGWWDHVAPQLTSHRVVALDHGVKIAEGSFDAVSNHPAVVEAYMGRHPEDLAGAE